MMIVGGLDIGQKTDHTCLVTMQEQDGLDATEWLITDVCQLLLQMPFRDQLDVLASRLSRLDAMAIDSGGTGQAVVELLGQPIIKHIVPMVIIGGTAEPRIVKGRVSVGKTKLVSSMMQAMFHKEMHVAPCCKGQELLLAEMQAFEWSKDGRFRKAEAAKGQHDDCVLALAMALVLARRLV
jgi:hypothetical protein